jgi:hypothetical protein
MKKGLFVAIVLLSGVCTCAMERTKRSLESGEESDESAKKPKVSQQSSQDWTSRLANFDALPVDIKRLIVEQLIAKAKNFDEAIKEVKKIRLISKASNAFITSPSTLQWLISKLANDFNYEMPGRIITEKEVFAALRPLTDSAEMQMWLEKQKPYMEWKKELSQVINYSRDLKKLKELLDENQATFKKDLNEGVLYGDAPLIESSRCQWLEGVQALLSYGADPNVISTSRYRSPGISPLTAIFSGNSVEDIMRYKPIVELLLKSGADINKQDAYGRSHLFTAVRGLFDPPTYNENNSEYTEYYDYIKYLLESGANPNTHDKQGMTPLLVILLANFRTPELRVANLVKLLLDFGADPNLRLSVSAKDIYFLDDEDRDNAPEHLSEEQIDEYFAIREILDKKG